MKVLIVDGHVIKAISNGDEALKSVEDFQPDQAYTFATHNSNFDVWIRFQFFSKF